MKAVIEWKERTGILTESGEWESDDPDFARYLNVRFNSEIIRPTPAAGNNQFAGQAVEAGKILGVEVEWQKQETDEAEDKGRVY